MTRIDGANVRQDLQRIERSLRGVVIKFDVDRFDVKKLLRPAADELSSAITDLADEQQGPGPALTKIKSAIDLLFKCQRFDLQSDIADLEQIRDNLAAVCDGNAEFAG